MRLILFINRYLLTNKKFRTCHFLQIIFCGISLYSHLAAAEFVVSLRSPETKSDRREDYSVALVKLALEKTKAVYGDYRIVKIPPMNTARSIYSLESDKYPNMLNELSYEKKLEQEFNFIYIDFPVELGIVGYRVCFASPKIYEDLKRAEKIEDLKKYTIGQGAAWVDTTILRHNGFKVVEISNFDSIFKLIEMGRIDLFCRGANELQKEYEAQKYSDLLRYDESFVLHYPLPRFYYLNKNSTLAKERIEKGLLLAYQDGSINKMWEQFFLDRVEFAKLKQRKVFYLENPAVKSLPDNYKKYFYDPLKKN